jgi:hypothetical protein
VRAVDAGRNLEQRPALPALKAGPLLVASGQDADVDERSGQERDRPWASIRFVL